MFVTRLLSGVVLVIIAFISFFIGAPVLPLVLLGVSLVGYRELMKALGISKSALEKAGFAGTVLYYLVILATDLGYLQMPADFALIFMVVVFLVELLVYVLTFPKYQAEQTAEAVFAWLYVPVMLSFIDFTRMLEHGRHLVWLVLICSWGCDTFAYCVGKLIGKKKIFPVLSPKKSLEGCIGGVLGAALLAGLYGYFLLKEEPVWVMAVIGAAGALISMAGDLAASAIKRNKGIKDYGKLIPGHGGIMDRFDSVIVTAPVVYFLSVLLFG